jgi:MFS family permease
VSFAIGSIEVLQRNRLFRTFWIARALSFIGDGIALTALLLYVEEQKSGLSVAFLVLARTIPRLVVGPFAGVLADRVDQRRLMLTCDFGQAVLFTIVALLLPPLPALLILFAGASVLAMLFTPAGRSAVPELVSQSDLLSANAWLGTALNLQFVAGSALGGLLVQWLGVRGALGANAVSFVASAALILQLPALRPAHLGERPREFLSELRAGVHFARRHQVARVVIAALFLGVTVAALDNVVLVFFAREDLGTSAAGFGFLGAAYGVGMVAISLGLTSRKGQGTASATFILGMLANGIGTLLTGLVPSLGLAVAFQAVAGAGNGGQNVASDTLIQQTVPTDMRGRIFGLVATASVAGASLAAPLGGLLLRVISARDVLVLAGGGVVAVASVAATNLIRGNEAQPASRTSS